MHVCVSMGQSLRWGIVCQSSLNVLCQQSDGCWVKTVMKALPLCSDTLWAVVSQHRPELLHLNRERLGWLGSWRMDFIMFLQRIVYRVSMEGSSAAMILFAVLLNSTFAVSAKTDAWPHEFQTSTGSVYSLIIVLIHTWNSLFFNNFRNTESSCRKCQQRELTHSPWYAVL